MTIPPKFLSVARRVAPLRPASMTFISTEGRNNRPIGTDMTASPLSCMQPLTAGACSVEKGFPPKSFSASPQGLFPYRAISIIGESRNSGAPPFSGTSSAVLLMAQFLLPDFSMRVPISLECGLEQQTCHRAVPLKTLQNFRWLGDRPCLGMANGRTKDCQ